MSAASRYRGQPVSEGTAVGGVYLGDAPAGSTGEPRAGATAEEVRVAFAAVAQDRAELARKLRSGGRDRDAGIVEIGALIAADPALTGPVLDAVRDGADAVAAVTAQAEAQAALLAVLPDPDLAQRAGDVRQVASAVIGYLTGNGVPPPPGGSFILVRREVDPADLIRLAEAGLAGAVSVGGGASSHAAIIARGLGVPMLAGADPRVLAAAGGHPAILDAADGTLIVDPAEVELAAARARSRAAAPEGAAGSAGLTETADGERVTVLCNVASVAETRLGLRGGASGVGLLRTEIPFTSAAGWPSEADHLAQLEPILSQLAGRTAVVRLLDFSGDKIPPMLCQGGPTGLAALLGAPEALGAQLRAILRAGRGTRLAVLVPMIRSLQEVRSCRAALARAAAETGTQPPELGIMIEVAATAATAGMFAPEVDFFSIGTNDLTSEVLGLDRADPGSSPALAADPRVLTLIDTVVRAGVKTSVCGDAAADPAVLPLLIGLGVRTLSVAAARVPQVARQIARTDAAQAAGRAAALLLTRAQA